MVISLIIQYHSLNNLGKVTHKVGKISILKIRFVPKTRQAIKLIFYGKNIFKRQNDLDAHLLQHVVSHM